MKRNRLYLALLTAASFWLLGGAGGSGLGETGPSPGAVAPPPTRAAQATGDHVRRVAFYSGQRGRYRLCLMEEDGHTVTVVAGGDAYVQSATWSPARDQVAFVAPAARDGPAGLHCLWVREVDNGRERCLVSDPGYILAPAWSPDGRYLAYARDRAGNRDLYRVAADGSGLRRLTDHPETDDGPAWSPDGQSIAFVSDREGAPDLYLMRADGSDQRRLTGWQGTDTAPAWSPDGQTIAFVSDRDGDFEIYTMRPDGSQARRLTRSPGYDWSPAWSPDGGRILFTSTRDSLRHERHQIYVMDADGTHPRRLSFDEQNDILPVWWGSARSPSWPDEGGGNRHTTLGN